MVLMIAAVLIVLPALFQPLRRNNFYMLHLGLVVAAAWYIETSYFADIPLPVFITKWRSVLLVFIVLHLISINFVTFIAYGVDKKAAQRGDMRSAAQAAQKLMQTPEGARLAAQLRHIFGK